VNPQHRFPALAGAFLSLLALLLPAAAAQAQQSRGILVDDPQDLINWYYAATFGTGVYTAGDRTVTVLQVPFSRTLRSLDERNYGLRLKVPVTLGFYDYEFDDVLGGDLPGAVATASIMPGLEWEMPLSRRWTIKPYFSAGVGQELNGHESALIYDVGVKSRYVVGDDRGVEFAIVNLVTAAGYRPRGGPSQPFSVLGIGLDMIIPANFVLFGRDASIGFTPAYYFFSDKLRFAEFDNRNNRLREQFELSLSVMSRRPWTLKYFDVDRIGFAIRSSDEVYGVSLFTSLPF
jgi:hypothetical protein